MATFYNDEHKLKAVQDIIMQYKKAIDEDAGLTEFMKNTPINNLWLFINQKMELLNRKGTPRSVPDDVVIAMIERYQKGEYKSLHKLGQEYGLTRSQTRNLIKNPRKLT